MRKIFSNIFLLFVIFFVSKSACNIKEERVKEWCHYISNSNEPSILIFNRLMKCGSSTMNSIISKLQTNQIATNQPSFYFHSQNGIEWRRTKSIDLYQSLQKILKDSNQSRMIIEGHFEWKSFESIKTSQMEYFQLLRNCPDRHTSNFFYRLPSHGKKIDLTTLTCLLNESCVEQIEDINSMIPDDYSISFCGKPCQANQAIEFVKPKQGKFILVGLLEYFIQFLEILECVYPTFFSNVMNLPNLLRVLIYSLLLLLLMLHL